VGINKLRAMEYLMAAVDHRTFAAAARHLGVAVPSVHRLIGALEQELGIALLHRDGKVLRPTRDAELYVDRVRRLLSDFADAESGLRDAQRSPAGTIVVASQGVVTRFLLTQGLRSFHAIFPNVLIDLRDPGSSRDLVGLGADILLQFGWPVPQDAVVRTFAYTRWLIVATPAFWTRHGLPTRPEHLADLPSAVFRTPFGEVLDRWAFARAGERAEVRVRPMLIGDDRGALDAPVLAGHMLGRINDLTAADALRTGKLQPVLLDWEGQNSPPLIGLVRKSIVRQPRVRAFLDHFRLFVEEQVRQRLPAGLPPVPAPARPDWFQRRVG
jgi:DNA-binding transcriptional LysR family regulator